MKSLFVTGKDGLHVVFEKATLRQFGGRQFLVGVEDDRSGKKFGAAPVWVSFDAITMMVELDAVKFQEKAQEK
jgi:hypothetical protein